VAIGTGVSLAGSGVRRDGSGKPVPEKVYSSASDGVSLSLQIYRKLTIRDVSVVDWPTVARYTFL
jgi:hypothetical protein